MRVFSRSASLLGLDLGFLVAGGGLDFGLFEDLAGFFLGVALAQVADQLDDAHAHEGGNEGDDDDQPGLVPRPVAEQAEQ